MRKSQPQNIEGHEIYAHNHIQSFALSIIFIDFEDLSLIFYIYIFNTTTEVIIGISNSNNTLQLLVGL